MKRIMFAGVVAALAFLMLNAAEAQWVQTTGIDGGQINSLLVKGDTTFAGTWGGGLFYSTNQGTNWVYSGLIGEKVRSMAVQGTNIFAGTHTGVWHSTNNGVSWAATNNGTQTLDYIYAMDTSGIYLLAGGYGGISRTSDGGATWTLETGGLPDMQYTLVGAFAGSSGNLFCGVPGIGVFRSTNHGSVWSIVDSITLGNKAVRALAMADTNLFAGTEGGVFHSTNNGVSWTEFNLNLGNLHVISLTLKGTKIFAGTSGGGVYESDIASAGWTAVNTGLGDLTAYSLVVNTNLFVGTNGGVFTSTNDGGTWTAVNSGLTATRVYATAARGDTLYAGAYGSGLFRSTDNGVTWTNTGVSNKYFHALLVKGSFVGAGSEGGFFYSTNSGSTWAAAATGLGTADGRDVRALAAGGTNLYAGAQWGRVYISTDGGVNWAPTTGSGPTNVTSLTLNGSILFAGTAYDGVFMSSDSGANWTTVNSGLGNLEVNVLATGEGTVFAGTGSGLFASTNNGTSWTNITGDLGSTFVFCVQPSGTNLFVGTRNGGGLFYTKNYAPPYKNVGGDAGLMNTWVSSMAINNRELYLGTSGSGVWKRHLVEMGYQIHAAAKVYLQGPYLTVGDSMAVSLRTSGILAAHFVGRPIPGLAVDSITIEIRDSSTTAKATVRKSAPAWLLSNGSIRNFSDTTKAYVDFDSVLAGRYYVVVWHRNHLGIMTASGDSLDAGSAPAGYDFTTGQAQAFGVVPMQGLGTGGTAPFGLYGGNASWTNLVINGADRTVVYTNTGATDYNYGDVNLTGVVNGADRTLARINAGKVSNVQ
jgi:hypothetical protein